MPKSILIFDLDVERKAISHENALKQAEAAAEAAEVAEVTETLTNSGLVASRTSVKVHSVPFISLIGNQPSHPSISCCTDAIRDYFETFGRVVDLYLPRDKPFCFLKFDNDESLEKALSTSHVIGNYSVT